MLYYAIPDLHGRFDLLKQAVKKIENDASDDYEVITLGDYIDRGPQSKEIIEYLITAPDNWTSLQGNHEAMMVETIRTPLDSDWWMGNGGDSTMASYGCKVRVSPYYGFPPLGYDPHAVPPEHVDWISFLPIHYETPHHIFVHAGIPFPDLPLAEQSEEKMQWMIYGKHDAGGWNGKHIVHGHHQHIDGPHEWSGRTALDTAAYYTGRLVVGVYSSNHPGKAIRYLEIKNESHSGEEDVSGSDLVCA